MPAAKSNTPNNKLLISSSKDADSSSDKEFLFEENETNSENEFQVQSFILPFLISCSQYEVFEPIIISAQPLAEKLSNPIYLSVCNFRI